MGRPRMKRDELAHVKPVRSTPSSSLALREGMNTPQDKGLG